MENHMEQHPLYPVMEEIGSHFLSHVAPALKGAIAAIEALKLKDTPSKIKPRRSKKK
jgi:hypothetical protein